MAKLRDGACAAPACRNRVCAGQASGALTRSCHGIVVRAGCNRGAGKIGWQLFHPFRNSSEAKH
jgi:hypothetical protein